MGALTGFEESKDDDDKAHKDIAVEFLRLVGSGKPKEGLCFFAPDCKTHNPTLLVAWTH